MFDTSPLGDPTAELPPHAHPARDPLKVGHDVTRPFLIEEIDPHRTSTAYNR